MWILHTGPAQHVLCRLRTLRLHYRRKCTLIVLFGLSLLCSLRCQSTLLTEQRCVRSCLWEHVSSRAPCSLRLCGSHDACNVRTHTYRQTRVTFNMSVWGTLITSEYLTNFVSYMHTRIAKLSPPSKYYWHSNRVCAIFPPKCSVPNLEVGWFFHGRSQ